MSTAIQLTPAEQAQILAQRAAAASTTPAPPQPTAPPSATDVAPASRVDTALEEAGNVAALLASGALGPQVEVVGTVAEQIAKLGTIAWRMFNPRTGATSKHPTLAAAKAAAITNLQTSQPGAVAHAASTEAVEITPVIHVTAQDAAAAGQPVGSGSTQS